MCGVFSLEIFAYHTEKFLHTYSKNYYKLTKQDVWVCIGREIFISTLKKKKNFTYKEYLDCLHKGYIRFLRSFIWIQRNVFENKLVQIILRILLSHLFSESTVNINSCFNSYLEALKYPDQVIFLNSGHRAGYGGLERLYGVMWLLSDLSLLSMTHT